jgi:putative transcriptional regulator
MTRKSLQQSVTTSAGRGFLDGQMLIASPGMHDERFSRSLIYMCAHSSEARWASWSTSPRPTSASRSAGQARCDSEGREDSAAVARRDVTVLKGGPVETERGFVLH